MRDPICITSSGKTKRAVKTIIVKGRQAGATTMHLAIQTYFLSLENE